MRTPISEERFLNCLRAGKQMLAGCQEHDKEAGHVFTIEKASHDIVTYAKYLKGNPDTNGSKLYHFFELMEKAKEPDGKEEP